MAAKFVGESVVTWADTVGSDPTKGTSSCGGELLELASVGPRLVGPLFGQAELVAQLLVLRDDVAVVDGAGEASGRSGERSALTAQLKGEMTRFAPAAQPRGHPRREVEDEEGGQDRDARESRCDDANGRWPRA